jgi:AmmeMemoRadiSam system protein B
VTREPAAAGLFYPAEREHLASAVEAMLARARPARVPGTLRALVVPHAGYAYSGSIAAAGFALLPAAPARVALLGPSHYVPLDGVAVSGAERWRTPLGDVPVDDGLRAAAVGAGAAVDDRPHREDHALEVELPFLQHRVGDGLRVVPVAAGGAPDAIAAVVAALAGKALVLVSTDLSHYADDATARRRDRRTADAVLALDADAIGDDDACGAAALRALVVHARREGWTCSLLELATSADATGDIRRVVGYGAFALTGP